MIEQINSAWKDYLVAYKRNEEMFKKGCDLIHKGNKLCGDAQKDWGANENELFNKGISTWSAGCEIIKEAYKILREAEQVFINVVNEFYGKKVVDMVIGNSITIEGVEYKDEG